MTTRTNLQRGFLLLLGAAALAFSFLIVKPFLGPIVSAGALAILFFPIHASLLRRVPTRPGLAAGLSVLFLILVIVLPTTWLIGALAAELSTAYASLKHSTAANGGLLESITAYASRPLVYFGADPADAQAQLHQFLSERLASFSGAVLGVVRGVLGNVALFLFNAVVALYVFFFLLRDGKSLVARARHYLPLDHAVFDRLVSEVGHSVLANVYGVLGVALAQGSLTGLLFYFTGVHSPVFWGVVAGFFSMIPIIGPPIVWAPVAIAFALSGAWGKAILVTVFGTLVVGTADNILRPLIVSGRVQLHPLLVFISLLGGAETFGFLGLFIGPAALSVTVIILEVLKEGLSRQEPVPPQHLPAGRAH